MGAPDEGGALGPRTVSGSGTASVSAPSDGPPASRLGGSDALWNAWDRAAERFEEASRHDAFLAMCEVSNALPFAAARYREWVESHPEDAIATVRLQRVAALAQMKVFLASERPVRDKDPVRQAVLLGVVLLLVLAVVVVTAPLVFRGMASGGGAGGGEGAERGRSVPMEPPLQNLRRPPLPPTMRPIGSRPSVRSAPPPEAGPRVLAPGPGARGAPRDPDAAVDTSRARDAGMRGTSRGAGSVATPPRS